jgi:hypothetical protein
MLTSALSFTICKQSAKKLRKALGEAAEKAQIAVGDVKDAATLTNVMQGMDSVVLCTSAVPKIKVLSLLPVFLNKLRKALGKEPARPKFTFGPGGIPEQVGVYQDYDACFEHISDMCISNCNVLCLV